MEKLLFIFTGGTIGSTVKGDYICTDSNKPYVLIEGYKKLYGEIGEYDTETPYTVLSENLNGEHIEMLISCVKKNLDKGYKGIVITHGTDTLAYTAAALSYAFGSECTPICLVSANFPLEDKRSNGYKNLMGALKLIGEGTEKGVFVSYECTHHFVEIHRASRLCPHTCFLDRVESVRDRVYAYLDEKDRFVKNPLYKQQNDKTTPFSCYDINISSQCEAILRANVYPGMVYPHITDKTKYVILDSYHSGTVDTQSETALRFYDEAKSKGVKVLVTGISNEIPYESTSLYEKLNIIPVVGMSPVAVYLKLWLIESTTEKDFKLFFLSLGGDFE